MQRTSEHGLPGPKGYIYNTIPAPDEAQGTSQNRDRNSVRAGKLGNLL